MPAHPVSTSKVRATQARGAGGRLTRLPAVLALGISCQIAQILLLRELLMVFHGNELSIGVILAAWMVWTGAGSALGSRVAGRSRNPVVPLAATAAGVLVLLPLTLAAVRGLRGAFDVVPGAYLSVSDMALSCLVAMAPLCLLLGAQFVLLARLWRNREGPEDTSGAGRTYIGEAAGNVVGGVLFTFVLVHALDTFRTAALAGLLMPLALFLLWRADPAARAGARRAVPALLGAAVAAGVLALPWLGRVDAWSHRLQFRLAAPDHELLEVRASRHGTLAALRHEDQIAFFQSGHLLFSAAGPGAADAAREEHEAAVFAHLALVQHPAPGRVLLIGGGLRGTLREILRHPVRHVDYVELDEELVGLARRHLGPDALAPLDDPRVRMVHTDGRLFVKATEDRYDLVLVDVPDPATAVLNRFYTQEFYREVRTRLAPGGVLATGVVSTAGLRGTAVANRNATVFHTLRAEFAEVLPVGQRFMFLFASDVPGQISADPAELRVRFGAREIDSPAFSAGHFDLLLEDGPLRRLNWVIRHHGRRADAHVRSPASGPLFPPPVAEIAAAEPGLPPVARRTFINTDFRPVGYFHTLVFWNVLTRAGHGRAFAWILRVEPWWIVPPSVLAVAVTLALRRVGRRTGGRPDLRFAVLLAVATTGLSTMALQVALLFAFQSVYGFVFEMVGLIVAMFMAGLALGTFVVHRAVARKADPRRLACVQLLVAGFAGGLAVALPQAAGAESPTTVFALFSAMTFGAGLLNGADFPLAAACAQALDRRPSRAVGAVYGVELFGASAGALAASVVVAPVLGIVACCLLACIANGVAFVALAATGRT